MLDVVYNFHNEIEKAKESNKEYGNKIFEILNGNSYRGSFKNYEKVKRFGIEPNKPFLVNKKKIYCVLLALINTVFQKYFIGENDILRKKLQKKDVILKMKNKM